MPFVSVIAALADLVLSVAEVAVRVTAALAGTVEGGVYVVPVPLAVMAGDSIPHPVVHTVPFCRSVQLACGGDVGSLLTVAVKLTEPLFTGMSAEVGETEMVMATTVTVTEPVCAGVEMEVAVMVTG